MTPTRRTFLFATGLFALLAFGASPVRTQGPTALPFRPERPIAIVGGMLIDGTGAAPRLDQTVVTQGDRIVEVGPSETVRLPAGAEVIDASSMTVMPGLINSNQHIQLNPLFPSPTASLPLTDIRARWEHTWSKEPDRAYWYLMQGITSMRNTSGPSAKLLPVKHAIDKGELPGPRIFLGGALLMSKEVLRVLHQEHAARRHRMDEDAVCVRRHRGRRQRH